MASDRQTDRQVSKLIITIEQLTKDDL